MAKSKEAAQSVADPEKLHKSLMSIGADKEAAKKITASKSLERIVIPVYWKEGLDSRVHPILVARLPDLLRSFAKEFPDGEIRWDPDYEGADPADDIGIRVRFNVQEDDQGNRWQPKPTLLEDESYQRMIEKSSYKGTKPVHAYVVIHGK